MATLSAMQIEVLGYTAGLPNPKLMAAIAMAESSGRTDVVNSIGCVGLWQINQPVHVKANPRWTKEWLKNPLNNAVATKKILEDQGLGAWEAYTNGAYLKYYKPHEASFKPQEKDLLDELGDAAGSLQEGAAATIDAAGDIASFMAKAGNWLSDPTNWIRVVYVVGGTALTIGGLVIIGRPLFLQAATSGIGKTVSKFAKGTSS